MRIATINVDVMKTATVTTVGARRRCPRTQEQRRGSGVAPEPDKWLTMRTDSAGGGHGPILLGKSEAGGDQLRRPRDLLIPTLINREIFLPQAEIFYIGRVKNLGFW